MQSLPLRIDESLAWKWEKNRAQDAPIPCMYDIPGSQPRFQKWWFFLDDDDNLDNLDDDDDDDEEEPLL